MTDGAAHLWLAEHADLVASKVERLDQHHLEASVSFTTNISTAAHHIYELTLDSADIVRMPGLVVDNRHIVVANVHFLFV